jgi:ParB family chromosome partitioning protein
MEIALIENIQREDLNPIEEAAAYKNLMAMTGLSQDDVAMRVGKNRSTVANALRLLRLSREIQDGLEKGDITAGHARAILMLEKDSDQALLYRQILGEKLNVREAEKRAASLNQNKGRSREPPKPPAETDADLKAMEELFIETLGTKVSIQGTLKKGVIKVEYYSMDDLDRLYQILSGSKRETEGQKAEWIEETQSLV